MHAGALRALEFDRIVEAVCRYALTPQGLRRLAALRPDVDPQHVASLLSATTETVRFLADNQIALQATAELETIVDAVAVEGNALDAVHLQVITPGDRS